MFFLNTIDGRGLSLVAIAAAEIEEEVSFAGPMNPRQELDRFRRLSRRVHGDGFAAAVVCELYRFNI